MPASFWNCNYQPPQSHHLHHNHHFQSNLVSDHSHHYLPLIEPSASSASLQPLLQLETLSQLTHLQNHHSQNSSAAAGSSATGNFTSSQHSAQNSSSLISNPINSLTFAHQQQQQLAQSVQPSSLPQQQQQASSASQQSSAVADLSAQPPFLQFLQQQSNHPFQQYAAAQNAAAAAAIQSGEPASNSLNSQSHLQQQHSNLAHHYNGAETPTNNGWPHSVFIPLASPASSSSCSSNAENNANRSNKLANNSGGSLAKQYDHLAKPAARFALTSSALLQLNSTGTSPNRSPLSTTTSSPAQISHNSSTLSPVAFPHSSSSNAAYQLSSSLFPASNLSSVNTAQLQANSSSNESVAANGYTSNGSRSPATTAMNSSTATATPALAKSSFTHLAHQSTDPWSHPSNSTQPYLAFHSANLAAGYSHSTPPTNSSLCGDKSDSNSSSTYNQYNSLLLAGGSINGNSLNNANNQSAVTKPAASLTSANQLPLAHPSMPNHLTNYNYYHLNPLNQANALTGGGSETAAPPAISFHHSTANSFHYHYHHHNTGNYNGYNYNYGLMPGKYRSGCNLVDGFQLV